MLARGSARAELSVRAEGALLAVRRSTGDGRGTRLLLANFGARDLPIAGAPWLEQPNRVVFSLGASTAGRIAPWGVLILATGAGVRRADRAGRRDEQEHPEQRARRMNGAVTWFKDAVFYELHVGAFADSNGDGIGDFPGLTAKLDYLVELGIDCIWLLPMYPSPLKDGGYDISDYRAINSS